MGNCVICGAPLDTETAAVLEMGAYGTPKYICDECSSDLDAATTAKEPEKIAKAVDSIAKKAAAYELSGRTFETVNSILESAAERAKAIKDGTYDFSSDEMEEEDSFDEIPEELMETEEDRELDRRDEEQTERVNKILDYMSVGAVIGILIFAIWKIVETFLL